MKNKLWILFIIFLVVFLVGGCRSGGNGGDGGGDEEPSETATAFVLPGEYIIGFDEGQSSTAELPAGKSVIFYCLTPDAVDAMEEEEGIFEPEFSFPGITTAGGTTVYHEIPAEYDGEELYPFALVILDDNLSPDDVDLDGKTLADLAEMVEDEDQLALGIFEGEDGPQPFTASAEGGAVELSLIDFFVFLSLEFQPPTALILPGQYTTLQSFAGLVPGEEPELDILNIPAGKTVKFYFTNELPEEIIDPVFSFTGTTQESGTFALCQIPEEYDGQELYPFALVILNDELSDFNMAGKTLENFFIEAWEQTGGEGEYTTENQLQQLALGFIESPVQEGPQPFTVSLEEGSTAVLNSVMDLIILGAMQGMIPPPEGMQGGE